MKQDCIKEFKCAVQYAVSLENALDPSFCILRGVRWIVSFLSADKSKTFCLYEAPTAEAIHEAARRAGIPADAITEVAEEIAANGAIYPLQTDRFE